MADRDERLDWVADLSSHLEGVVRHGLAHLSLQIHNMEVHLMSDQSRLDADVQKLVAGLSTIEAEIAALKSLPAAAALDFSGLDAAVARVGADASAPAPTPAPPTTPPVVPVPTPAPTTPTPPVGSGPIPSSPAGPPAV